TRFSRDWSSDVCSSDLLAHRRARHPVLLGEAFFTESFVGGGCPGHQAIAQGLVDPLTPCVGGHQIAIAARTVEAASTPPSPVEEIGRASCRERGQGEGA